VDRDRAGQRQQAAEPPVRRGDADQREHQPAEVEEGRVGELGVVARPAGLELHDAVGPGEG